MTVVLTLAGFSLNAAAVAVTGSQLEQQLKTMKAMVVVSYEQMEALTATQISKLIHLGTTQIVQFKSLPMIGVVASPTQIKMLEAMKGSLYFCK